MSLPTTYADGQTIHGSDLNTWTVAINADTNAVVAGTIAGETSTATSSGTVSLTIASTQIQKFTGSTTGQIVALPTTSVVIGNQWMIVNASTVTIQVNASGGATVLVLAAGTSALFTANTAGASTAGNWDVQYGGVAVASGKELSISNTMTLSAADGASFAMGPTPTVITAAATGISTTQAIAAVLSIPANSLSAGQSFGLQSFGTQSATTCNASFWLVVSTSSTATTTATASVAASAVTAVATSGGTNVDALLTIRTSGSGGTCIGGVAAMGSSQAATNVSASTATLTINTTVQNYITFQAKMSTGTHTVQQCIISGIPG
jgi:hypothetical protein